MKIRLSMIVTLSVLWACSGDKQPSETPTSEAQSSADMEGPPPAEATSSPQPSVAAPTATATADTPLVAPTCKKSSDCKGGKVCCGSSDGMLGTQCVAECDWMSQAVTCGTDADCKKMPTTIFGGTKIKIEGCKPAEKNAELKFCKFDAAK